MVPILAAIVKEFPASTADPEPLLFTSKMTVVCTGIAVRAAFLKSIKTSRDEPWMATNASNGKAEV
jgi:hypothetical protein